MQSSDAGLKRDGRRRIFRDSLFEKIDSGLEFRNGQDEAGLRNGPGVVPGINREREEIDALHSDRSRRYRLLDSEA